MHRSGTSALARAVNLAGAYLGEQQSLIGPRQDNPEGFWERADFNQFQDRLLLALKRRWDLAVPIPEKAWHHAEIEPFVNELTAMVRANFTGHQLWAWKDPRSSVLLPLWRRVLKELGVELFLLLAIRNPLDVARSLERRDGFSVRKTLGLWLAYNLAIIRNAREIETTIIHYDDLLEKGVSEVKRCFDDLAVTWNMTLENEQTLGSFLRSDLRHEKSGKWLSEENYGPVALLYNAMLQITGAQTDLTAALPPEVGIIEHNFNLYSGYFETDIECLVKLETKLMLLEEGATQSAQENDNLNREIAAREKELTKLRAAKTKDDEHVAHLKAAMVERDQKLAGLEAAIAERDQKLAGLEAAIAERDERINAISYAFSQEKEKATLLTQELSSLRASTSWKITAPLRWIVIRGIRPARAATILSDLVFVGGGLLPTLKKASRVAIREGLSGIRSRLRYVRAWRHHHAAIGSPTGFRTSEDAKELLEAGTRSYDSEYQGEERLTELHTDIKAIAFYLPQFHAIAENDEWWGEGFTEWTNTRQARPRFQGHYQPRESHQDIGYYDLSDVEAIRKQVALARRHGIYGFCSYYYWFSGRRLLKAPLDQLLENPDINIHFCLCWANENWTRTWDGLHQNILMEQQYLPDDPVKFMRDIRPYLEDRRYIRVDGKPVIMVYKPHIIPDVKRVFDTWRQWWKDNTGGGLQIWCNRTSFEDPAGRGLQAFVDAIVEFPPHIVQYEMNPPVPHVDGEGHFFDYQSLVRDILDGSESEEAPAIDFYRSVMLGWDNSARRRDGWSVWYGFSLDLYYSWLRQTIAYSRRTFPPDRRFIFINAWNEWAEGTYLEPDKAFGYASLNVTSRALFDLPIGETPKVLALSSDSEDSDPGSIAVHLHIFFVDLASELLQCVNRIPYPFDLFVTTDTLQKADQCRRLFETEGKQERLEILQVPNAGRDIGPLLVSIGPRLKGYDYVGHFHTKKSTTVDWGDHWRRYLLANVLGSEYGIRAIFQEFRCEPQLGLIYPETYPLIAEFADWGQEEGSCRSLLRKIGYSRDLPQRPNFPAGNMFWARVDAIEGILGQDWRYEQFGTESGQIERTLQHAVERCWTYAAAVRGYYTKKIVLEQSRPKATLPDKRRLVLFAHYGAEDVVSDADLFYLQALNGLASDIVFISNSRIAPSQEVALREICRAVIQRPNLGFDFGAWRDGIREVGWPEVCGYEEVIFTNNSCYGPVFPFAEMFDSMSRKRYDFWGLTGFPAITGSSRPEAARMPKRSIPEHLQSYFLVFSKKVVQSRTFQDFWASVQDKADILEVVAKYEATLTAKLSANGFRWGCYIPESFVLQERKSHLPEFNATYNLPIEMLLLRSPLLKKKVSKYALQQVPVVKRLVGAFGHFPADILFK